MSYHMAGPTPAMYVFDMQHRHTRHTDLPEPGSFGAC